MPSSEVVCTVIGANFGASPESPEVTPESTQQLRSLQRRAGILSGRASLVNFLGGSSFASVIQTCHSICSPIA